MGVDCFRKRERFEHDMRNTMQTNIMQIYLFMLHVLTMNRMKFRLRCTALCHYTPLNSWMQIIQRLRYTSYHRRNGNELTILVHWNSSLLHARTIQPCSLTAVGVCCWLQSRLNKLDGVLIEQGTPTMLSQEINQYGAFEMRHIGEALKQSCSHGTRL